MIPEFCKDDGSVVLTLPLRLSLVAIVTADADDDRVGAGPPTAAQG